MSDHIVEIGGKRYSIGRLNVIKQFHVARRLGSVVNALGKVKQALAPLQGGADRPDVTKMVTALEPLIEIVGQMPDKDADYIIQECLTVVRREDPASKQWLRLTDPATGQLMYQDIDMPGLMQLVWAVISENLTTFFGTAPQTSPAPASQ